MEKIRDQLTMTFVEFLDFAISITNDLAETHKRGAHYGIICPESIDWERGRLKTEIPGLTQRDETLLSDATQLIYVSPEQTRPTHLKTDCRADLYSLGIIFYELLVGEPPFTSTDPLELIHSHLAREVIEPFKRRREIPKQISSVIMRLLEKEVKIRYQSAIGLQFDLEQCRQQWKDKGVIEEFALAKIDYGDRVSISKKFYGREKELSELIESFEKASAGRSEFFLLSGYSGVGKTALVHEFKKDTFSKPSLFIEGKFDQFQKNKPYLAWIQAFEELAKRLLMEDQDRLSAWKTEIQKAIGDNGKILTDVFPGLELIIGPQPNAIELSGTEAQNRFNTVVGKLVNVIADKELPLIIFLDDLQWIDSASISLLDFLVSGTELNHVLIIGSYRDNEVVGDHLLIPFLMNLKKETGLLKENRLQNLSKHDINSWLSDSLSSSVSDIIQLSELLYSKTLGNPFFTLQLLQFINEERLLTQDASTGILNYDMESIEAIGVTQNVADFLSKSIRRYPESNVETLKLAACLGKKFDINGMCLMAKEAPETIEKKLDKALQDGILIPSDGNLEFAHDKIHEAVYALIPEGIRQKLHLKIGRFLLEDFHRGETDDRIFEIAYHLNIGKDLSTSTDENYEIALHNLSAGKKAMSLSSYDQALTYFEIAIELLREEAYRHHYRVYYELFTKAAEAALYSGAHIKMKELIQEFLINVKSVTDKAKVISIQIIYETNKKNHGEAIKIGLNYLKELGIELDSDVDKEEVSMALSGTIKFLKDQTVERILDLPVITDSLLLSQLQTINSIISPCYFSNSSLLIISVCKSLDILIQNGNTSRSAFTYACFSLILTNVAIGDYQTAKLAGEISMRLLKQSEFGSVKCPATVSTYGWIFQYTQPLKSNTEKLFNSFDQGVNEGNLEYASYAAAKGAMSLLCSGENLKLVYDRTQKYSSFFKKHSLLNGFFSLSTVVALTKYLTDPKNSYYDCEYYWGVKKETIGNFEESQVEIHRFYDLQATQMLAFHFGQYEDAYEQGTNAISLKTSFNGSYPTQRLIFYDTLVCLRLSGTGNHEKEKLVVRIDKNLELLKTWATLTPMNFEHMHFLAQAEQVRNSLNPEKAARIYELAIESARSNGFLQDLALSYDLAAQYYSDGGFEHFYEVYMKKAHQAYRKWGASALVKYLEIQNPGLFEGQSSSSDQSIRHEHLDLITVSKASKKVSNEFELNEFLQNMMNYIVENAGAQKGFLILKREGEWFVEAYADSNGNEFETLKSINIKDSSQVSTSIVRYVSRTRESIILSDARKDVQFKNDPIVLKRNSKSLLCIPIINQTNVSGVLYLENNLIAEAFTHKRIELLKLLSFQMSLAVENVAIYKKQQRSEQRFRSTFMNASVGMAHVSLDGDFLRLNQKFCDILGYSYEELRERKFQDITHPDHLDKDLKNLQKLLSGEINSYSTEKRYIKKDGDPIWISLTVSLNRDENGEPQWFISVIKDINRRKLIHDKLRISETNLKSIFETSPVAQVIVDQSGRINRVNKQAEGIFGFDRNELIGELVETLLPRRYRHRHKNRRMGYSSNPDNRIMGEGLEFIGLRKDGSEFPVEIGLNPIEINGESMVLSAIVDITQRKAAADKLRSSEAKYRNLVDNSMVGVFTSTTAGDFLFVNEAMVKMFEFDAVEQMIESANANHLYDHDKFERLMSRLVRLGEVQNFESKTTTRKGKQIYVLSSIRLTGDKISGMVMDISDRKQAEKKILQHQRRLKDMARELTVTEENVKKQIAEDLHDHVGQILTSARMHLSGIQKMEENEIKAQKIESISNSLKSAVQSTRSAIFNLSLPQLNEISLFAAVQDWLSVEIATKYDLLLSISGEEVDANFDENTNVLLYRSVKELVMNVVKHANATRLDIDFSIKSDSLVISVQDDGNGFIYDPLLLQMRSESYGLFSIYERMNDLGGFLRVNSKIGFGTVVKLTVPIKDY